MDKVYSKAQSRASRFNTRQIIKCLWCMAKVEMQQQAPLIREWLLLLTASDGAALHCCSMADLASVAYTATKLPQAASSILLDCVANAAAAAAVHSPQGGTIPESASVPRPPGSTVSGRSAPGVSPAGQPQARAWQVDACLLLACFATLAHHHAGLFKEAVQVVTRHASELPTPSLTQLVWAVVELDALDPHTASSLAGVVQQRVHELAPKELAVCARSLAALQLPAAAPALCAVFQALNEARLEDLDRRALHQALQAHSLLHPNAAAPSPPGDERGQLPELAAHLRGPALVSWTQEAQQTSHSGFHEAVLQVLQAIGLHPAVEVKSDDGMYSIDLVLDIGGVAYAIEVDGPSHSFTNQPSIPTGATRMRNTALAVRGWAVVCVQHCVWRELEVPAARQAYLQSLLAASAAAK